MNSSVSRFDRLKSKITNNPILASVMILGMIITALSAFTDATRNLLDLVVSEKRPAINGEWVAEITYPSRSTKYSEVFSFSGNETGLQGTASYLEKEQIIVDGTVIDNQIEFKTKTMEYSPDWNNDQRKMATHQYRGTVSANGIEFVMETHGGFSTDPPLKFIAKKGAGK
jgi:hypothetical protein